MASKNNHQGATGGGSGGGDEFGFQRIQTGRPTGFEHEDEGGYNLVEENQWQQKLVTGVTELVCQINRLLALLEIVNKRKEEEVRLKKARSASPGPSTGNIAPMSPFVRNASMAYGLPKQATPEQNDQLARALSPGVFFQGVPAQSRIGGMSPVNYGSHALSPPAGGRASESEYGEPASVYEMGMRPSLTSQYRQSYGAARSPYGARGGSSPMRREGAQIPEVINLIQELGPLGKFEKLNVNDGKAKLIAQYVSNSHDVPGSMGKVNIHGIYQLKCDKPSGGGGGGSRGSSSSPASISKGGKGTKGKGDSPSRMLLWYKTSPGSVRRLAEQRDGCVAFYDRVARAFAVTPEKLTGPLRQTIILCSVTLGKVSTSPYGYQHWSRKGIPQGSDTIRGVGRLTSDWGAKREDEGVTVPVGKTTLDQNSSKSELEYSEYIIFEARRVRVKYAVDLEIVPEGGFEYPSGTESAAGYYPYPGGEAQHEYQKSP